MELIVFEKEAYWKHMQEVVRMIKNQIKEDSIWIDEAEAMKLIGIKSKSEMWSTITRLISSAIRRLKERSPASTCATGMCIFAAASAPARVEFVSPNTTAKSGRCV